jgi:hypothetical protein
MKRSSFKSLILLGLLGTTGGVLLTSCGSGGGSSSSDSVTSSNVVKRSELLASITDAQWADAKTNMYTLEFIRPTSAYATAQGLGSAGTYQYRWIKDGAEVNPPTFNAMSPYVIKFVNKSCFDEDADGIIRSTAIDLNGDTDTTDVGEKECNNGASNGGSEHYFTAPSFFKSIVLHKVETADLEYKAPYLLDFELNAPGNNVQDTSAPVNEQFDTWAYMYFVPVVAGEHELSCKLDGVNGGSHSTQDGNGDTTPGDHSGMFTTVTISGSSEKSIDFELKSDFDSRLALDYRRLDGEKLAPPTQRHGTVKTSWKAAGSAADNLWGSSGAGPTYNGCAGKLYNLREVNITDSGSLVPAVTGSGTFQAEFGFKSGQRAMDLSPDLAMTFTDYQNPDLTAAAGRRCYKVRLQLSNDAAGGQATGTEAVSISSELFSKVVYRKFHDRNLQIKPIYFDSIKFLPRTAASDAFWQSHTGEAQTSASTSDTQPKRYQVDLWFTPEAEDFTALTDLTSTITIGAGAPLVDTTFKISPSTATQPAP